MAMIVVFYELNPEEYPDLLKHSKEQIEYWAREGYLSLGGVNSKFEIPSDQELIDRPTNVVVVK